MAEATLPQTRSGALDLLADRLRQHYGDCLHALYALPDDPYEPQGDPDALHVLAVLPDEGYDWHEAQREITRVGVAFDRELDFHFVAMLKVFSASEVEPEGTEGSFVKRKGGSYERATRLDGRSTGASARRTASAGRARAPGARFFR